MKRYQKLSVTLLLLSATALAGVVLAAPPSIPPSPGGGLMVNTSEGPVRGFVNANRVTAFLGIPYAAPPVGNLRWMPPQPSAKHGLLDATEYADTCPQVTTLGAFAGPTSITEDCLYLNVFTPNAKTARGLGSGKGLVRKRLPVMVWIHGGALAVGESDDYDPTKLVDWYGWTEVQMIRRFVLLGVLCFVALAALYAWGVWQAYRAAAEKRREKNAA